MPPEATPPAQTPQNAGSPLNPEPQPGRKPPASRPQDTRPLLTIAVPTWNRTDYLTELLSVLEPQLASHPEVELLICDNGSDDDTPAVCAAARQRIEAAGGLCTVHRHPTNIGSDANFAACFRLARGHFFWMCGDDDIIVPGALAEVLSHLQNPDGTPADLSLIYATSYGFRQNWQLEREGDPFHRRFHTIRNPRELAMVVNIMFTFISGIITNKALLELLYTRQKGQLPTPDDLIGTNLVQLGWSLPLLPSLHKAVVLWNRPVAARQGNANGYSIGMVFGERLAGNLQRLLPGRSDLQRPILNFALRRWFPSILLDVRSSGNKTLRLDEAHTVLKKTFGRNPRYWLFTWPALAWPLPLAKPWTRFTAALSKLLYMAHLPLFWRKETH